MKGNFRSRGWCPRSNNTPTSAEYWQIERPRWTAKPFSRWPRRGKHSRDAPKRIFVRRDGCPVKIDPPAQLRSKPPEPVAFLDEAEADVLAYMTFPAQHRAFLTGRRRVILGHHVQLVLRSERPPAGLLGHLRIRALLLTVTTPASPATSARSSKVTVISGKSPSPPSGKSVATEGRVPHDSLAAMAGAQDVIGDADAAADLLRGLISLLATPTASPDA